MSLCLALAMATERIEFGTSIANMYTRHVADYAQTASFIHEMSNGRFRFGIGVSHEPALDRLGVNAGRPPRRTRARSSRTCAPRSGSVICRRSFLRPCAIACVHCPQEIGDGMVFANAARSAFAGTLDRCPDPWA